MNGEPGSLWGVSRARAAPPQRGGRVFAPGAGRADVRGSGPALLLECGWACLRAGYLCWCASPDLDGPASSYCRGGGAFSAQASALPSPERIPGRAASRSPQCFGSRFSAALLLRVWNRRSHLRSPPWAEA